MAKKTVTSTQGTEVKVNDLIEESELSLDLITKLNSTSSGVQILTQSEYDSLDEATQNNGTLYLIQVSDTEFIYANNSGSTFDIATVKAIVETYTTENLVVSDSANDGNVLIYPNETNFTKTVTKTGTGVSKVFAKSKTGYMSLVGDEVVRIGNGNININKSHATGILCRMNTDDLIGKTDNVVLLGTQQVDVNGKQHFSIGWGGANAANTVIRNLVYVARAGDDNGTPADIYDTVSIGNGWSNNGGAANDFKVAAKDTWIWIWAIGKDESDEVSNYKTMNFNGGSTNFQNNNGISVLGKIHGSDINIGSSYYRKKGSGSASYTPVSGVEITSKNIEDSSLLIYTNGVDVDIASIVHINDFDSLKTITMISHGAHPEQLGIDLTDGFAINFGEQPSIVTVDTGTPTFNKSAADSPESFIYAGTNETDNAIEFNLKSIV